MWFVCDICPQPNTDCLTILLSQNNLSKSSLQDNSRPKSAKLDVSNELQRTIWRIFTPIKVTHNNHSRLEQMKVNRGVNSLRIHIVSRGEYFQFERDLHEDVREPSNILYIIHSKYFEYLRGKNWHIFVFWISAAKQANVLNEIYEEGRLLRT